MAEEEGKKFKLRREMKKWTREREGGKVKYKIQKKIIIEETRKRKPWKKRGERKNEELRTYFYNKSIVETFRKGRPTLTPLK